MTLDVEIRNKHNQPRGGLSNKGRYGCAASAKPWSGKISQKKPNARAKSAQKPDDQAGFYEL